MAARPAAVAASPYRIEGGVALIELRLRSLAQLFNSFDPSPFHAKDLDADAEAYIVTALGELPAGQPSRLVIHLPPGEAATAEAKALRRSIGNYFAYRAEAAARDLRTELRLGRDSLTIGLAFLAVCMLARHFVESLGAGPWHTLAAEGLLISGWVAMWRPIQIFLYDWWPIRRRLRVLRRLAEIEVETRPDSGEPPLSPV